MRIKKPFFLILGILTVACFGAAPAEEQVASLSTDAIINLPLKDAWNLFATTSGWTSMGYGNASVELKFGGRVHAEQNNRPALDAAISSFEPERMLALTHADGEGWSVLYFQAMGQEMTGLRWVELTPAAQAQNLQPLAQAHRALFDRLIRRYAPECELCKKEREAAESK